MRIIVPASSDDCIAHRALVTEGLDHEVHRCYGAYGYGELLAALWVRGEGFVLVEHDIAPWPGAIQKLLDCHDDWCSYQYPLNFEMAAALGCTKFSDELLAKTWRIPQSWSDVHWGAVDGKVVPRLQTAGYEPHIHNPPVAHVRGPDGGPHR